jgi:hypothetical protein
MTYTSGLVVTIRAELGEQWGTLLLEHGQQRLRLKANTCGSTIDVVRDRFEFPDLRRPAERGAKVSGGKAAVRPSWSALAASTVPAR